MPDNDATVTDTTAMLAALTEESSGAGGGGRTRKSLVSPADFKSAAYANFATPARLYYTRLHQHCQEQKWEGAK